MGGRDPCLAPRGTVERLERRTATLGALDADVGVDLHEAQAARRVRQVHARRVLDVVGAERIGIAEREPERGATVDLDARVDGVVLAREDDRACAAAEAPARGERRAGVGGIDHGAGEEAARPEPAATRHADLRQRERAERAPGAAPDRDPR